VDGTEPEEGLDNEILQEFLVESFENLAQLDLDLVALEEAPDDGERLRSVFRTVHTIKGVSGFLGFEALERVAHAGESLLARVRDGELALTAPRASALFAMGRTADNVWAPQILAELERGAPPLRFEAARAAGELELAEAVPALQQLIEEGDIQCREAAIWSLGQIGGDAARTTLLKLLEETDDEEEVDFIEDALDNLAFTDGTADFFLFDFAEESESNAEADNTED